MLQNIKLKELSFEDLNGNLLNNFNRYQKANKYWSNETGNWTLIDKEYVVDWDKNKKDNVIQFFFDVINDRNGYIFGAYENRNLIGFSVLLDKKFGTNGQYIQLKYLHISYEHRHKGIGKRLFELCIEKAKTLQIEKIYISANDSEDTQKFYLGIGCIDAIEINKNFVEEEPYDRQMEYTIKY
jgi:GNAT superfamily N-acetyltransferase